MRRAPHATIDFLDLKPDVEAPQTVGESVISWTATVAGGAGTLTYEFYHSDGTTETMAQTGPASTWAWRPTEPGAYRVRVVVTDARGESVESDWSSSYIISDPISRQSAIAVLPLVGSGEETGLLQELHDSLVAGMGARGLNPLADRTLQEFMARQRIRYTGGLTAESATAFREELDTRAVLMTSLDLYDDSIPPRIGLTARLTSTGPNTTILWMESVALMGYQAPGILGRAKIEDPAELRQLALTKLMDSLAGYLFLQQEKAAGKRHKAHVISTESRFRPRSHHRHPDSALGGEEALRVAVLPFHNESTTHNAGQIVQLQLIKHLSRQHSMVVMEPGLVRQALLQSRLIMQSGLSFPQADLLRAMLDVDLVLIGEVLDYQEGAGLWGDPKLSFSVRGIDTHMRQVVWSSVSDNRGDDGVFFFDHRRVWTAHALASRMASQAIRQFVSAKRP